MLSRMTRGMQVTTMSVLLKLQVTTHSWIDLELHFRSQMVAEEKRLPRHSRELERDWTSAACCSFLPFWKEPSKLVWNQWHLKISCICMKVSEFWIWRSEVFRLRSANLGKRQHGVTRHFPKGILWTPRPSKDPIQPEWALRSSESRKCCLHLPCSRLVSERSWRKETGGLYPVRSLSLTHCLLPSLPSSLWPSTVNTVQSTFWKVRLLASGIDNTSCGQMPHFGAPFPHL